jgi:site-specific recombinase XerD
MTTLPRASRAVLPALDADLEQAVSYARAEKASATRRAYHSDFTLFESWCAEKGVTALPAEPETVAAFLAFEANRGIRPSTITRRAASIRYAHKLRDHEPPTNSEAVRASLRGIRRSTGTAKVRKAPILAETARAMAQAAPDGLKGLRDRALLLVGCMARFRQISIMNDMERIERDMLRVSDEPLQVRVETFNSLMFEFLSKYGSPGIQERLGKLLNKD